MDSKTKNTIAWIVTALIAFIIGTAGISKLIGVEDIVQNFQKWGYSDIFRYAIGGFQIAGAIGLFIPSVRKLAAMGIIGLMIGAIYTHVSNGEPLSLNGAAVGVIALCGLFFWLRK